MSNPDCLSLWSCGKYVDATAPCQIHYCNWLEWVIIYNFKTELCEFLTWNSCTSGHKIRLIHCKTAPTKNISLLSLSVFFLSNWKLSFVRVECYLGNVFTLQCPATKSRGKTQSICNNYFRLLICVTVFITTVYLLRIYKNINNKCIFLYDWWIK